MSDIDPEPSVAEQYTVVSETEEDLTDYDDVGFWRQYAEAFARSQLVCIPASVLNGWTQQEYQRFVETGEQPSGKEFDDHF